MATEQTSVRLSKATKEKLDWLANERYNTATEAIAIAINWLYSHENPSKNAVELRALDYLKRTHPDLKQAEMFWEGERLEVIVTLESGKSWRWLAHIDGFRQFEEYPVEE